MNRKSKLKSSTTAPPSEASNTEFNPPRAELLGKHGNQTIERQLKSSTNEQGKLSGAEGSGDEKGSNLRLTKSEGTTANVAGAGTGTGTGRKRVTMQGVAGPGGNASLQSNASSNSNFSSNSSSSSSSSSSSQVGAKGRKTLPKSISRSKAELKEKDMRSTVRDFLLHDVIGKSRPAISDQSQLATQNSSNTGNVSNMGSSSTMSTAGNAGTMSNKKSKKVNKSYLILVMDNRATRIANAALRMYEITEEGLALVESLEKQRQPLSKFEVIYLIEPTEHSVKNMCDDFADPKAPMYGDVHVFFTRPLRGNSLLKMVKESVVLKPRIKTLVEANVDFLPVEQNVFHLDMKAAPVQLYGKNIAERKACIQSIVESLVCVCLQLNEFPFLRFETENALTRAIAEAFYQRMQEVIRAYPKFWFYGDGADDHGGPPMRGTLFLFDRQIDVIAPFLHEFTYQALVHDLFETEDDMLTYYEEVEESQNQHQQHQQHQQSRRSSTGQGQGQGQWQGQGQGQASSSTNLVKKPKTVLLNENDPMWQKFRHLQIRDVIERLRTELAEQKYTSVGKIHAHEDVDLEEMAAAVRDLPFYKEIMSRHVQHFTMAKLCMETITAKQLFDVAQLEQAMATRVDSDGKEVSASALTTQLMQLVRDPNVSELDTIRLLALYIISQGGIKPEDRQKIFSDANPPVSQDMEEAIINLTSLGVNIQKIGKPPPQSKAEKQRATAALNRSKTMAKEARYPLSRYVPKVSDIVGDFCRGAPDNEKFQYLHDPEPMMMGRVNTGGLQASASGGRISRHLSVRSHKSSTPMSSSSSASGEDSSSTADQGWEAGAAELPNRPFEGGRIIVFMAGGATFSETRSLTALMRKHHREVVIGTTHLLRPHQFIQALQNLGSPSAEEYLRKIRENNLPGAAYYAGHQMDVGVSNDSQGLLGGLKKGISRRPSFIDDLLTGWGDFCSCCGGSGSGSGKQSKSEATGNENGT